MEKPPKKRFFLLKQDEYSRGEGRKRRSARSKTSSIFSRGISSNGIALASHVRGSGIDARILQKTFKNLFYLGGESPVNVSKLFFS